MHNAKPLKPRLLGPHASAAEIMLALGPTCPCHNLAWRVQENTNQYVNSYIDWISMQCLLVDRLGPTMQLLFGKKTLLTDVVVMPDYPEHVWKLCFIQARAYCYSFISGDSYGRSDNRMITEMLREKTKNWQNLRIDDMSIILDHCKRK